MEENRVIDGYMMLWLPELEAWDIKYEVGVSILSGTKPDPAPELQDHIEIKIHGCECLESNVVYRTRSLLNSHVDEAVAAKYDFGKRRVRLTILGGDQQEISGRMSAVRIGWGMEEDRGNHAMKIHLKNEEIQNLLAVLRAKEGAEMKKGLIRLLEAQSSKIKNDEVPPIDAYGMRVHVFMSNVRDMANSGRPYYDIEKFQFL